MFETEIAKFLEPYLGISQREIAEVVEIPPDPDMGDYAVPCFSFANVLGKDPKTIAEEAADKAEPSDIVLEVESEGAYVNIFLKREAFIQQLFQEEEPESNYKTVVIDYSSPNIAKPFSIGHLRSTVIGNALKNIYEYMGWETIGINHIGDWGTQFGNLMAAYKKWNPDLEEDPIKALFEIYVKFSEEAEDDEELQEKGREWFKRLEDGDKEAVDLWAKFRKLSLEEFDKIYDKLGVEFDYVHGESFYNDKMEVVFDKLEEKGLLEESEGAMIVDLEDYDMPPCIIRKSDGATTYHTRDLAGAIYREKEYEFDKNLYEVGSEQSLHFQQVFKVLELMGYEWFYKCSHVKHGLYGFDDKKMSTRKGNVVFIEDLLQEAEERVTKIIDEKNPDLDDKEEVAEQVGVGAIIFNDLKNDRVKNITFDWDEALNLEGDSGPYLQYTHARIASIFRKSKVTPKPNEDLLREDEEIALVKHMLRFHDILEDVIRQDRPHILARWLLDLAQMFNHFYGKHRVIQESKALEAARLALLGEVKDRLAKGLELLGIEAPEEM